MDYASVLSWTLYALAGFGLTVLLILAWMGGTLVFLALRFAVQLAFAEAKAKRLRRASTEAQQEFAPKPSDFDQPQDNNGNKQQTNRPLGSQSTGG